MIVDYMLWRWTFELVWGPQLVEIRFFVPRCWKTALQQHAGGLVPVRWWEERVFLQTSELELKAKGSILLPSEQRVFFLSVWGSFRSLVHRRLLLRRSSCLLTQLSWGECFRIGWPSGTNSCLLTFSPDCPASSAEGFGISEQCSQQEDFISFPTSFPPWCSPLSELWGTFYWSHGFVLLGLWVFRLITSN